MVHCFYHNYQNERFYFIWEVERGSLYAVDETAFLIAKNKYEELTDDEKVSLEKISDTDIAEVTVELNELNLDTKPVDYTGIKFDGNIKAMCLHICHDCNLACKYCFASEGTYNTARDYMSREVGFAAIDFLIKHSGNRHNLEIDFFGGEPLLNLDVVKDIVAYARDREKSLNKHFSFTMTTNAVLLNKETSDWLNAEMDNVVISIDGRKNVHNACRTTRNGKDCYDVIVNNAKYFRSIRGDKRYYIRGTFTGKNLDFANDVAYLNDLGFDQISIEPVVLPDNHELAIKDTDLEFICKEYDKLANMYMDRRKTNKWFNFFHFMIDLEHGPCVKKRTVGCGSGNEYIAVTPTGEIYPCHQFANVPEFYMGTVFDDDFNRDIQKKFADCNLFSKEECKKCWAKYYCSGGCVANAYHFNGDLNKPYHTACVMMRKRIELSLAIHSIEKECND